MADGKFRFGPDPEKAGRFVFNTVVMITRQSIKRSPLLSVVTDELPFILADGAGRWRLGSLVKLRSALDADEVFHRDLVTQASCLFGQAGFQPALNPAGRLPVRRTARMAVLRRDFAYVSLYAESNPPR